MKGPVEPVKVDVRKKRGDYPALRSPLFGTADGAVFFPDLTLKPLPDQFEDTPLGYAPLEFFHQRFMGDAVKLTRKIRVIHFQPSELEVSFDLVEGSVGAPFGAKSMGAVKKVRLEDRFEDKKHGCLDNSIPHARYAERAQVAVGLGDIDATHRGWFVAFGSQAFLNFVKIAGYSACLRLDVLNTDSIDSRRSLVRLYSRPRRFQYVTAMDSVVKGIEPKLRFSFGLAAQFPPQKRDFYRHTGFRYEPFRHPFRYGASVAQAGLLSFHENTTEVRPLGSTGITPLPSYYGPLRIPTVHARRVIDSPPAISLRRNPSALGSTSDLPGSLADLSTRALPYYPEQSDGFKCPLIPHKWQASPYPGGWPLLFAFNEADTGSLALGSRLRRQGVYSPFRPKLTPLGPTYYPCQVTRTWEAAATY